MAVKERFGQVGCAHVSGLPNSTRCALASRASSATLELSPPNAVTFLP